MCTFFWQAGEGAGVQRGIGKQTPRPGSTPQEAAEGAKLWLLPAQDADKKVWSIFPNWYPVYHFPRRLHVRHPSGAQVGQRVRSSLTTPQKNLLLE